MVRLDFLLDNPAQMSTSQVKARLKSNLAELFTKEWKERIAQATPTSLKYGKLRCFKLFKTKFEPSTYLQQINDFAKRQRVAKFRCSDHDLMIELGWHKKLSVEERVCKNQKSNSIFLHSVEFSNVHNCDRSSNATRSSRLYNNFLKIILDPGSFLIEFENLVIFKLVWFHLQCECPIEIKRLICKENKACCRNESVTAKKRLSIIFHKEKLTVDLFENFFADVCCVHSSQ